MKNKIAGGLAALLAAFVYWFLNIPSPPNGGPLPTPTVTASPVPSPTEAPTILPTPSPAATPTPEELPTPGVEQCVLPPSTGECIENPNDSRYLGAVREAQAEIRVNGVVVTHTDNPKAYIAELSKILRQWGYCAINGREGGHTSDDEVWVKKDSNAFSEHFDVITSNGDIWSKHAARCVPAKF